MIKGKRKIVVKGFENYVINEDGIIYHQKYISEWSIVQYVNARIDRGGYLSCRLSRDGQVHTKFIHRLLAQHFIPNPLNLSEVNHKDGNRLNNALWNLEWITHRANVQHAYQNGLNSSAKRILDIMTGQVFLSIRQAADAIGLNYNTCCKRLVKNLPDFRLRYFGQTVGQV